MMRKKWLAALLALCMLAAAAVGFGCGEPETSEAKAPTFNKTDTFQIEAMLGDEALSLGTLKASDGEGKDITSSIVVEGTYDLDTAGDYSVTFKVTADGKTATLPGKVKVVDDRPTKSDCTLAGFEGVKLEIGDAFDAMSGVSVACDNLEFRIVADTDELKLDTVGNYDVVYTVYYPTQHELFTVTRSVSVFEKFKVNAFADNLYVEQGKTLALDDVTGVLLGETVTAEITGTLKSVAADTPKGSYIVNYAFENGKTCARRLLVMPSTRTPYEQTYLGGPNGNYALRYYAHAGEHVAVFDASWVYGGREAGQGVSFADGSGILQLRGSNTENYEATLANAWMGGIFSLPQNFQRLRFQLGNNGVSGGGFRVLVADLETGRETVVLPENNSVMELNTGNNTYTGNVAELPVDHNWFLYRNVQPSGYHTYFDLSAFAGKKVAIVLEMNECPAYGGAEALDRIDFYDLWFMNSSLPVYDAFLTVGEPFDQSKDIPAEIGTFTVEGAVNTAVAGTYPLVYTFGSGEKISRRIFVVPKVNDAALGYAMAGDSASTNFSAEWLTGSVGDGSYSNAYNFPNVRDFTGLMTLQGAQNGVYANAWAGTALSLPGIGAIKLSMIFDSCVGYNYQRVLVLTEDGTVEKLAASKKPNITGGIWVENDVGTGWDETGNMFSNSDNVHEYTEYDLSKYAGKKILILVEENGAYGMHNSSGAVVFSDVTVTVS